MNEHFSAQQRLLGSSELQRFCGASTYDIVELASRSGWRGLQGDPIRVAIGTAINMRTLSIGRQNGVEYENMMPLLPSLRNEALLILGVELQNWALFGSDDAHKRFDSMFHSSIENVRQRVAPLLKCCLGSTAELIRFHSASNIEILKRDAGYSSRPPRFSIYASELAAGVRSTCEGALFTVQAAGDR